MNEANKHRIVMVFSRKKDNPNQNKSTICLFQDVATDEQILAKKELYELIAKHHNARVYVSVNYINFIEARKDLITRLLKQQFDGCDSNFFRSVISSCMRKPLKPKKFMIDMDTKCKTLRQGVVNYLKQPCLCIDTENGYHLICEPFNVEAFERRFREFVNTGWLDVKKNGMTKIDYIEKVKNEKT